MDVIGGVVKKPGSQFHPNVLFDAWLYHELKEGKRATVEVAADNGNKHIETAPMSGTKYKKLLIN